MDAFRASPTGKLYHVCPPVEIPRCFVAFEFSVPWSTLMNVRMGRGLSSTIQDKGGGGDLRFVVFRAFDRWSRKPAP